MVYLRGWSFGKAVSRSENQVVGDRKAQIDDGYINASETFPCRPEAPSTRIRLHIVFIKTRNFSLRFHLASTRKRSKAMIVFIENDNF